VGLGNNTSISGSALAAATGWHEPSDNPGVHFEDTVTVGKFVNDQKLVEIMVGGAKEQIHDLERLGVQFIKKDKKYWVMTTPGHTYPRIFKPRQGVGTGHTIPLRRHAAGIGVRTVQNVLVTKLLQANGTISGAVGIDENGDVFVFHAKSVILTTGGLCQLFDRTTNVLGSTGDGYILGYKAGASLQDMEFIQFLPACMGKDARHYILYEAFIYNGAIFKNSLGEDICIKHGINNPREMTRDRLSRIVMLEIIEGRGSNGLIIFDLSAIPRARWEELVFHSPRLARLQEKVFEVAPSAHHAMGGVKINEECETGVDGLFAAGEVCGGIHGANRLGPNAITEIFVFGTIAGRKAAERALNIQRVHLEQEEVSSEVEKLSNLALNQGEEEIEDITNHLKKTMWHNGGIVRSEESLKQALEQISAIKEGLTRAKAGSPQKLWQTIELGNMLLVSEMILTSALMRTESRGAHYRSDYPEENSKWLKNILISKEGGRMRLSIGPVDLSRFAP
jgi:succinate dehydrogenase/fumarate reductase flavoprotein subunit